MLFVSNFLRRLKVGVSFFYLEKKEYHIIKKIQLIHNNNNNDDDKYLSDFLPNQIWHRVILWWGATHESRLMRDWGGGVLVV